MLEVPTSQLYRLQMYFGYTSSPFDFRHFYRDAADSQVHSRPIVLYICRPHSTFCWFRQDISTIRYCIFRANKQVVNKLSPHPKTHTRTHCISIYHAFLEIKTLSIVVLLQIQNFEFQNLLLLTTARNYLFYPSIP